VSVFGLNGPVECVVNRIPPLRHHAFEPATWPLALHAQQPSTVRRSDTSPQSKFFVRSIETAAPSLGVQTSVLPVHAREAGLAHDHSDNPVLEQEVIANFAAKDLAEGEFAEKNCLTLKRDSSINRYPLKLRDDEREEEFLRAWIFIGERLIVEDLKPESMEVTVAYRRRP
jgi:hypothetical protein